MYLLDEMIAISCAKKQGTQFMNLYDVLVHVIADSLSYDLSLTNMRAELDKGMGAMVIEEDVTKSFVLATLDVTALAILEIIVICSKFYWNCMLCDDN